MKHRVLFVCVGNAVRSQIAEGFAHAYGREVVAPASCGINPAGSIDVAAVRSMEDIGIDISEGFPKHFLAMSKMPFDLVVNISGYPLPGAVTAPVREWEVDDPVGLSDEDYRRARDLLQKLTLGLVDELRALAPPRPEPERREAHPSKLVLDRRRRLKRIDSEQ